MNFKKIMSKLLIFGVFFSNTQFYSFYSNASIKEDEYSQELDSVKIKGGFQKSVQKDTKEVTVDTWITNLTKMPVSKHELTSSVVNEKIYCIGGITGTAVTNTLHVYDPQTNTWEAKSIMNTARVGINSAAIGDKIYVVGGLKGSYLNKMPVYDTKTDTWEYRVNNSVNRAYPAVSVVDGKLYVIGGEDVDTSTAMNTVEVYDPETDSWTTRSSMPTARAGLTSSVVDGKIYCIGGQNGSSKFNKVEVYDPETNTWETKTGGMSYAKYNHASSVVDGKIYTVGGNGVYKVLDIVEVYDPETNTWETKNSMPSARTELTSSVVNGKIYCIGGYSQESVSLNTVEAYVAREPLSEEELAEKALINAESTRDPQDIENAKNLIDSLPESSKKDELKNRLDELLSSIVPSESQVVSSNADIYIKMSNVLSLSLDTNSVTFEDFDGVEDMEMQNAITLTVESSLPYEVIASLEGEVQGIDTSEVIDKSILSIKAHDDNIYNTFSNLNTMITILDNQESGKINNHGIDLRLNKNVITKTGVYKAVVKFEVKQK